MQAISSRNYLREKQLKTRNIKCKQVSKRNLNYTKRKAAVKLQRNEEILTMDK